MQVSMNDYNRILNIVLRPECIGPLLDDKITPAELAKSIYAGLESNAIHFIEDDKVYIRLTPFIGTSGILFVVATKGFRKYLVDYMQNIISSGQLKKYGITKLISFVRSDNKPSIVCNQFMDMKKVGEFSNISPKNGQKLNYIIFEREV